MSDQQVLAPDHFQRVLNNIKLQMNFLRRQESFSIKLLNLQNLQCFEQIICSTYLRDHGLLGFFETPKNLMRHLAAHYRDISIERGIIRFSLKYSEVLEPKQLTLNIREKDADKVKIVNKKTEQLKKKQENSEKSIQELRREVLKLSNVCQDLSKTMKNFILYPFAHPYGHQNNYFSTYFTGKSIVVNHNHGGQEQFHMFVLNQEIRVGDVKRYTIKTESSEQMDQMCFCFGSRPILRENDISKDWIVAYECNGGLNEGGRFRDSEVTTSVANQFQCEINLINYRIQWIKKGERFATTELPQDMKNQTLFFAVRFSIKNERIDIIVE